MWRVWIMTLAASMALALAAWADDEPETKPSDGRRRGQLSEAQKALRAEMLLKYDKNKNDQIDAEERAAITLEDQARLARAGLTRRRRPEEATPPASPPAPTRRTVPPPRKRPDGK